MYRDFYKKLISIVLPIAFQQFMLALVSASDALMLGKLDQSALSAVSLASQMTFVESLFLAAMVIGLSTFAAQYWGKGDMGGVEEYFAYAFKVTVCIAALFMVAGFLIPRQLMNMFTTDILQEYFFPLYAAVTTDVPAFFALILSVFFFFLITEMTDLSLTFHLAVCAYFSLIVVLSPT